MKKTILAIVGLPGSGKTEATVYVQNKYGWPKVYFGDVTFEEMKKQGLEVNETNERATRERVRREHGMGAYALLSVPKIKELYEKGCVILESLYSWEEYLAVKDAFGDAFKVLAIMASPAVRQERMVKRPVRPLTPEDFVKRDYSQIENLHQAGPIARADFAVINEGTMEDFHAKIDEIINRITAE